MPSSPPNLLDERARPRGGQVVFIVCVALDAAVQPGWPLALGIGAGIALGVVFFAMQGARVVVGADRILTYSLHGRPNLTVALAQVTTIRPVEAGLVRGLGLELADPRQVRFLHKGGISPERMRTWREQYGVDLVLEGFAPDQAGRLLAIRDGAAA
jgi:hypothetical protein